MCKSQVTFDFDHVGTVRVMDHRGTGDDVEDCVTMYRTRFETGIGCVVMLHAVPATLTPDVIVVPDTVAGTVRTIYVAAADPAEVAAVTAADAALAADYIGSEPTVPEEDGYEKYYEWRARCRAAVQLFAQAVFLKPAQHEKLTAALTAGAPREVATS